MAALLCSIFLVIAFAYLLKLFDITKDLSEIITILKSAIKTLGSVILNDIEKGRSIRRYANRIFMVLLILLIKSSTALFIPFGIIWLAEKSGFLAIDDILVVTVSWPFIGGTLVLSILFFFILKKKRINRNHFHAIKNKDQYTESEKWLHNLAFHTLSFQISLSHIESLIHKKKLDEIEVERPIFITALPRSGTTLLLELFTNLNELVTHTYRNMPFVLLPLFWNSFSKNFRTQGTARERSHGDGMMISPDNPEAFEEIIWKSFWPSRYRTNRIVPWTTSEYRTFDSFFKNHMRKVILLHKKDSNLKLRYISKNNLNIARISYLKKSFPDSFCIVPFRNPFEHASSLLRQHKNFSKIHSHDSFSLKYMSDIGHFEFGHNIKPIDFQGWISENNLYDPFKLEYWLNYWKISYGYLLKNAKDHVNFITFEKLCKDPVNSLRHLAAVLEIKDSKNLLHNAERISLPKSYEIDKITLPDSLVEEVNSLYTSLKASSII